MLKKIHRFFLVGILCLTIMSIVQPSVIAKNNSSTSLQEQMELIQNDIKVDDLDIEPINTDDLKKNVIPDTKKEGQKVLALFFTAMLGVAISGLIVYFAILFIRKYRSSAFNEIEYDEYAMMNLTTPENKQEAFISFLNRTTF